MQGRPKCRAARTLQVGPPLAACCCRYVWMRLATASPMATTVADLIPASWRWRSGYQISGRLPTGSRALTTPPLVRGYSRLHSPPARMTTSWRDSRIMV
jgi:hypothetical protein